MARSPPTQDTSLMVVAAGIADALAATAHGWGAAIPATIGFPPFLGVDRTPNVARHSRPSPFPR